MSSRCKCGKPIRTGQRVDVVIMGAKRGKPENGGVSITMDGALIVSMHSKCDAFWKPKTP